MSAVAGSLSPGHLIGDGRYRLLAQFGEHHRARAQFWRAWDGQLSRDVALTILIGDATDVRATGEAARALERVTHASTFTHPGVARVLDVFGLGNGVAVGEGILGVIVAEWTAGTNLIDVISDGPVPGGIASRLLEPLAGAVEAAHHAGLALGVDHPQRIRVTPAGTFRLAFPGPLASSTLRDDVKGLGALLYLLLTGRWALPDGPEGIPAAPIGPDGTLVAPHALRPMVPLDLSSIAVRSLEDTSVGGIRTSAAILQVLDRVAEAEAATVVLPATTDRGKAGKDNGVWITKQPVHDKRHKRRLALWVTVLAVATVIVVTWVLSSIIGFFGGTSNGPAGPPVVVTRPPAAAISTPSQTTSPTPGQPIRPATVTEFDAQAEPDNPDQANRVIDGDPVNGWRTDQYFQQFPALRSGIGLMAAFAAPVSLTAVWIDAPSAGTVVEIRTANTANPQLSDTQLIGTATLINGRTVVQVTPGQPAQYVLVWITRLAPAGGAYGSTIGEVTYLRAR